MFFQDRKKIDINGFTLVELMIVIAIAFIATASVYPVMSSALPSYRLKKAARDLMSNMQLARVNAIKNKTAWRINFNVAANTYQLVSSGPDGAFGTADDPAPSVAVNLNSYGSGVAFGSGAAVNDWNGNAIGALAPAFIGFNSRGLVTTLASVYVDNQINSICFGLTTSLSGGVRLRMYNGGMTGVAANDWID